jgi:serine/threonine protein kinase
MTLAIGTQLGPYEVLARVGAGGMGEIYRARDPRLGREVAVKVLPAAFATDRERLQRFEQEARAAGALNHPNILAVYDVGTSDGAPYLVTELLEGQDLRERLASGPISPRQAILCIQQTAQGLAAAHAKGIIHRDLKPENLFLLHDGRIKILDFGLAKLTRTGGPLRDETGPLLPSLTATGTILGTASYMAPEQVRDQPTDHRADLFSLGAILSELLTGGKAFPGETPADRMSAILHSDPPDLPGEISRGFPGIGSVLSRCLEKRPENRFDSARDLAFALGLVLEAAGVGSGRGQPSPPVAGEPSTEPTFRRLTFAEGSIENARFTRDGQTVVYSGAMQGGPNTIYVTRVEYPESRPVGPSDSTLLSVSSSSDLAIRIRNHDLGGFIVVGMMARLPLVGGVPRELVGEVCHADWAPDGKTLAVVREFDAASRLEYPIGKQIHQASGWMSHPRVSPDGRRVAFLNHPIRGDTAGGVAVIPVGGDARILTSGWNIVGGLAWGPRDELWFSGTRASGSSGIFAVSQEGVVRSTHRSAGLCLLCDISPAGDMLFLESNGRMRLEIGRKDSSKTEDLSWFDWTLVRAISRDGTFIIFDESGAGSSHKVSLYMRATDGSPAVYLADGYGHAISPDGAWVLAHHPEDPHSMLLLPTGAGEVVKHSLGNVELNAGQWALDGRTICLAGREPGERIRLFRYDLERRALEKISEQGAGRRLGPISPDGRYVVSDTLDGSFALYPMEGGVPQPLPSIQRTERPTQWTPDGRALYVFDRNQIDCEVHRIDIATGKRDLWLTVTPQARSGADGVNSLCITPDGSTYAASYIQLLSTLYVARGLC